MDVDGCANLTTVLEADAILRKQIQRSVQIDRYFIDFKSKYLTFMPCTLDLHRVACFANILAATERCRGATHLRPTEAPVVLGRVDGEKVYLWDEAACVRHHHYHVTLPRL